MQTLLGPKKCHDLMVRCLHGKSNVEGKKGLTGPVLTESFLHPAKVTLYWLGLTSVH